MAKILAIGSVTKDIFFPTSEGVILETPEDVLSQKKIAFELGAKLHIKNRQETLGGCCVNVACGLARLGEEAGCYVPIGDDENGEWAKKEAISLGIDSSQFKVIPGIYSDLSAIIVDENSGERTIFSSHTASEKFEVEENHIGNPEWIFIGDLSGGWKNNLDVIISLAREKNISLAFNPRQKAIHDDVQKNIETIAVCKILFLNKDEAIEIVSSVSNNPETAKSEFINNEEFLIKELKKIGAEIVVLTNGIDGAWAYDGLELLHADAIVQKAIDTTGAGDAFSSGFFAAYLKGKGIAESLKWGIANSSSSVTEYGGQKGLLNEQGIGTMASQVNIDKL